MSKKYDVFISYRRQGGEQSARILCERLSDMGDIIIGINGQVCRNYNDFNSLRQTGQAYSATLLRAGQDGKLAFTEVEVPAGQPKIQLLDLSEEEE